MFDKTDTYLKTWMDIFEIYELFLDCKSTSKTTMYNVVLISHFVEFIGGQEHRRKNYGAINISMRRFKLTFLLFYLNLNNFSDIFVLHWVKSWHIG